MDITLDELQKLIAEHKVPGSEPHTLTRVTPPTNKKRSILWDYGVMHDKEGSTQDTSTAC